MSPASLSRILNGNQAPTIMMIEKVGVAMGFNLEKIVKLQKETIGFGHNSTDKSFVILSQDLFSMIADWYHLTILEIMKLEDFVPDNNWIATRLEVNVNQIKLAI